MTVYEDLKTELLAINQNISILIGRIHAMPEISQQSFQGWENICHSIKSQLSEELIRVAVIGTIKSGKSTLINSLFAGDYLKRGAGVVTSMVTRVRRSDQLNARLYFKSWDQVNADIKRSLVLFPSLEWRSRKEPFDICRQSDREELEQALGSLEAKHLLNNDSRNLNSLYLSSYLRGYDRVKDFLASDDLTQAFCGKEFSAHRDFSGNEVLAFYLKDISLEIDSGEIENNIEIADCQGSDSPNPLHMAMIQDYLLLSNLLIYVISSRTGIRQADINFLSMIRKMGIIDHIIFVVNCDLSEHESYDELQVLIGKVKEDLAIIKKDPEVYTYSALYSLFKANQEKLSAKDFQRLTQWEGEAKIIVFSDSQEKKFITNLRQVVTRQRYALLFNNHFERLKMIVSGLNHWIRVNQDVLSKGADAGARLLKKIKSQQKKTNRVKTMVKSTLEGAVQQIKREIRTDVDRFFDNRSGEVVPALLDFVTSYNIPLSQYQDKVVTDGFSNTLYLVFQDFQRGIDTYMAENINPQIFNLVKNQEIKIKEYFEAITGPYEVMVNDALSEYNAAMERLGLGVASDYCKPSADIDLKTLKQVNKLAFPPAAATMNYSTVIKTEAIMRLGVYNFIKQIKRLIRQPVKDETANALSALKDAIKRMKKETKEGMAFHFKNYRENLKFQYIFQLVDVVSDNIYDVMIERFHDYTQDLSRLTDSMVKNQVDKEQVSFFLQASASTLDEISGRINQFGDMLKETVHKDSG
jgi:GTPase SAR1 family protein